MAVAENSIQGDSLPPQAKVGGLWILEGRGGGRKIESVVGLTRGWWRVRGVRDEDADRKWFKQHRQLPNQPMGVRPRSSRVT